ncbi:YLP motif-containing protein 1-like protein [Dinothrombium tinctorium]|uniref:YLP motif-containing protein 1 n=1 Tax=Dinothrombium tinctorium TaxID=1965070 RepID=A0A3S3P837_9ACAR|nr:YLP motif-containing protein 1-like protein [Dinothrombium tinctorium]
MQSAPFIPTPPATQLPSTTLATATTATTSTTQSSTEAQNTKNDDTAWMQLLNTDQRAILENLKKQQEEFEIQLSNWDKEFEVWREKNANHPDKSSYFTYAQQWEMWKNKLIARSEQMQQLYSQTLQNLKEQIMPHYQQIQYQQNQHQMFPTRPPMPPPPFLQPPPLLPPPVSISLPPPSFSQPPLTNVIPPPVPPPPPAPISVPPPPPPPPPPPSSPPPPPPLSESSTRPALLVTPTKSGINDSTTYREYADKDKNNRLQSDYDRFIRETTLISTLGATQSDKSENNEKEYCDIDSRNDSSDFVKKSNEQFSSSIAAVEISKDDSSQSNDALTYLANTAIDADLMTKAIDSIAFVKKKHKLLQIVSSLEQQQRVEMKVEENEKKSTSTNTQKVENMMISSDNEDEEDCSASILVPGAKPFNLDDAISKMKAIKPPPGYAVVNPLPTSLPQTPLFPLGTQNTPDQKQHFTNVKPLFPSTIQQGPSSTSSIPKIQSQTFNELNNSASNSYQDEKTKSTSNQPNLETFSVTQRLDSSNASYNEFRYREEAFTRRSSYVAKTIDYQHKPSISSTEGMNLINEGTGNMMSKPYIRPRSDPNFSLESLNSKSSEAQTSENQLPPNQTKSLTYRDPLYFTDPPSGVVSVEDLLTPPSRDFRPPNIVIILRGLPGSGKTFFAKLVKDKEVQNGGSPPRILSLDDYFMVEKEREDRKGVSKVFEYEYDNDMEDSYRVNLLKSFKKTIDDGYFPIIIIDAVNELVYHFEDAYNYAVKRGFVVYIAEMDCIDPVVCHKRNIHNRSLEDIRNVMRRWQPTPRNILKLDCRSLLQNSVIKDVDMEPLPSSTKLLQSKRKSEADDHPLKKSVIAEVIISKLEDEEEANEYGQSRNRSRWEKMEEESGENLDRLDAFKMKKKITMDEYLQLPDDYDERSRTSRGPKRVRWADIEERKSQERLRKVGFVVGQNWQRVMDPHQPDRVLARTKYF